MTVKGKLQTEDEGERGNVFYRERRYGKFERSFSLPTVSDIDAIDAGFEYGILTVPLPNLESAEPKKLPGQGDVVKLGSPNVRTGRSLLVLTLSGTNRTATLPNESQKQVQLATAALEWQM